MILGISIITLLLSIILSVYNYSINRNTIFLAGFLIPISIYGILHYAILSSNSVVGIALMYGHFMPIFYLPGIMLLFYVQSTLQDESNQVKWKNSIHFIPFLISLITIIPYYFVSFNDKLDIARTVISHVNIHKQINITWLYPNMINTIARPFILAFYSIACLIILYRHKINKITSVTAQEKFMLGWLTLICSISLIISISYSITTFQYITNNHITNAEITSSYFNYLCGITYAIIPLLILIYPEILYGIPRNRMTKFSDENGSNQLHVSALKMEEESRPIAEDIDAHLAEMSERIMHYIYTDKPYLDHKFNIEEISNKLNIPKHHVYYAFSNIIKKKFTKLRTELRVEQAKQLLLTNEINVLSLEGIWLKSGFSSKTSFFTSFKEESGLTPIEYIEQNNRNYTLAK